MMLVGKKMMNALGGRANDSVGSDYSTFAKRQLEKFGWSEGKGLGKKEDGVKEYIKIAKKDDNAGVGLSTDEAKAWGDQWWNDAFNKASHNVKVKVSKEKKVKKKDGKSPKKDKKVKKDKKEKKDKKKKKDSLEYVPKPPPTDAELFAATGGARLGMRARRAQPGKLKRDVDQAETFKKRKASDAEEGEESSEIGKKSSKKAKVEVAQEATVTSSVDENSSEVKKKKAVGKDGKKKDKKDKDGKKKKKKKAKPSTSGGSDVDE